MCHVLIIEDDWFIADHMAYLVTTAGALTVDLAVCEDDAVEQACARPPQVIISDVNLGSGGTGPAAVSRIFARLGECPVLFVTGEPRAFQPGSAKMHVLHKPVNDQTLIASFTAIAP